MLTQIRNVHDVKAFAKHLVTNEKLVLHPDDDFQFYVDSDTNLAVYTKEEADLRNGLMEQCFELCGDNVYDLMNDVFLLETGMYRFIPLSTDPIKD